MRRILLGLVLLGGWAAAQSRPGEAETAEPGGGIGRIAGGIPVPLRVVGGRLVVPCDISSPARRIPAHLLVQLEQPFGLRLHPRALQPLRIEPGRPLTLHFPGLRLETADWAPGGNQPYSDFTKRYAPELNEIALVGSIGSAVLGEYHLVLDLPAGVLRLGPPAAATDERPDDAVAVEIEDGRIRLPLRYGEGATGWMLLATSSYDTFLDQELGRKLGYPAGELGAFAVGTFDVARRVAPRPGKMAGPEPATTGLNLLEQARITIDRVNGFVRIEEARAPAFPKADLAYFRAEQQDAAAPLEAWLGEHAGSRLAPEAAALLLRRRLRDEADDDVAGRAVRYVIETQPEDLRTSTAWELMSLFEEADRSRLVLAAGELGLRTGRKDRDAQAVYKLHSRMGEVHLAEGDRKKAWRHLLSAAFGYPDHGPTNYWLGRFYETEGRLTRAFSRYLQAAIQEETTRLGMEGLERVQGKLKEGERLDVETVEKLVSGKVPAFTAPDRFEEDGKTGTKRVVLAELFTHSHVVPCLAPDLAFDGLLSHFPRERVAVLVHHISAAGADGLACAASDARAAELSVTRPGTAVIDGQSDGSLDLLGRDEHVEDRYRRVKAVVRRALKRDTRYALAIDARRDGARIFGSVTPTGPEADRTVTVLLVEKGVVFAGRSKIVVHHMVVRDRLARAAYRPGEAVPFEIDLSGRTEGGLRAIPVDPRQVAIVAFLGGAHGVSQAAYGELRR